MKFEWDLDVRPQTATYFLRLPARPPDDTAFWQAFVQWAQKSGLTKVAAASDAFRQSWVGSSTRLHIEPYYGSGDLGSRWAALQSSSGREARAFHEGLATLMGWDRLHWLALTREPRPADFYYEERF